MSARNPRRPARGAAVVAMLGPLAVAGACAAPSAPPPVESVRLPPPPPVEAVSEPGPPQGATPLEPVPAPGARDESPLAGAGGAPVTFDAVDADVRSLLTLLAEAAGVDLILGPDVQGRVSIAFEDVPPRLALLAVLEEAGLEVYAPMEAPYGPVVFYAVPVDVNRAGAEAIERRFGVSEALAQWIIKARRPPPE